MQAVHETAAWGSTWSQVTWAQENISFSSLLNSWTMGFLDIFMYFVQHYFICRPSDSTLSRKPRKLLRLWHWQSDALTTRLDFTHARLDLIHNSARCHPRYLFYLWNLNFTAWQVSTLTCKNNKWTWYLFDHIPNQLCHWSDMYIRSVNGELSTTSKLIDDVLTNKQSGDKMFLSAITAPIYYG